MYNLKIVLSYCREGWVKTSQFSWVLGFFFFSLLHQRLQIPLVFLAAVTLYLEWGLGNLKVNLRNLKLILALASSFSSPCIPLPQRGSLSRHFLYPSDASAFYLVLGYLLGHGCSVACSNLHLSPGLSFLGWGWFLLLYSMAVTICGWSFSGKFPPQH